MRVSLDGAGAPIHVANFCELAGSGFYDGLKFHRYVPGFVIQGGCPNTRDMTPRGRRRVAAWAPTAVPAPVARDTASTRSSPVNPSNSHEDGALAMARSADPNSAGSQFYFCLGPQHGLDSGLHRLRPDRRGYGRHRSELRAGDVIDSIRIEHARA